MATVKSYTDIEKSKKLAEFLPLESADMMHDRLIVIPFNDGSLTPCWSLAALLDTLPFLLIVNNQRYAFSMHKGLNKDGETYVIRYNVFNTDITLCETDYFNNIVDACYEMILKLKENSLL